jgi:periplasmic divalent cation tolerance protein
MNPSALLILTTAPDALTAERIAALLVESRLAACVNILPGVRSVYRWQGAVEKADEVQLFIKTTAARYPEVEAAIRSHHPHAVPEIIALPITLGWPAYLQWLNQETQETPTLYA